jgi:hypothetical protein
LINPLFLIRLRLIDPGCFVLSKDHAGHHNECARRYQHLLHNRLGKMNTIFTLGLFNATLPLGSLTGFSCSCISSPVTPNRPAD